MTSLSPLSMPQRFTGPGRPSPLRGVTQMLQSLRSLPMLRRPKMTQKRWKDPHGGLTRTFQGPMPWTEQYWESMS
jgi:hypothetical protein